MKKLCGFSYSKNIAYFEVFCRCKTFSKNLYFWGVNKHAFGSGVKKNIHFNPQIKNNKKSHFAFIFISFHYLDSLVKKDCKATFLSSEFQCRIDMDCTFLKNLMSEIKEFETIYYDDNCIEVDSYNKANPGWLAYLKQLWQRLLIAAEFLLRFSATIFVHGVTFETLTTTTS